MALSYRTRRRLSLFLLLVWLPLFVVAVVTVMSMRERMPLWQELGVYVGFGLVWALPFRFVFRGIGRADPEAEKGDDEQGGEERNGDR
ncbi:MAG: DUF2842 domain-containing protein [Pikeienuella sp.]